MQQKAVAGEELSQKRRVMVGCVDRQRQEIEQTDVDGIFLAPR